MIMNVFKRYYYPWKYPSNWFKNIKTFFRGVKFAYQRATRGFADCDIWCFDWYLAEILSKGLKQLADIAQGYPGVGKYDTFEAWQNDLYKAAAQIAKWNEDESFDMELYRKIEIERKEAFNWINENFHYLWD